MAHPAQLTGGIDLESKSIIRLAKTWGMTKIALPYNMKATLILIIAEHFALSPFPFSPSFLIRPASLTFRTNTVSKT
jgi:hypothetical protein